MNTTRKGGCSTHPYAAFNLSHTVGDDHAAVRRNRRILIRELGLTREPLWLRQVHGVRVIDAGSEHEDPEADAVVVFEPGPVCAVLSADCLPVLFCSGDGTRVGAAHAGWRGLAQGVLTETVRALDCEPRCLMAWLGPAIGPDHFEVGEEVRDAFLGRHPRNARAFVPSRAGHWRADLYQLARNELGSLGVRVHGGEQCTYAMADRYFSYRRDGCTGRMASLIWLERADHLNTGDPTLSVW